MTRPAECHPDRKHEAQGLCRLCYQRRWKRQQRIVWPERNCKFCSTSFRPSVYQQTHCSSLCQIVRGAMSRTARDSEELMATRSRTVAERLVRGYLDRGCRRVSHKAAARQIDGPYVAAWHRGEGLFLIRARLPREYREEAA